MPAKRSLPMSTTARQRLSFYLLVLLTLYAGFVG